MKKLAGLAIVAAIASCSVPTEDLGAVVANSQPPSSALRAQIVGDARNYLADPYSVRDAEISNVGTFSTGVKGVCVRANAKNKMGGYTGRQTLGITIQNGALTGSYPNHPYCGVAGLGWRKFPELEALKNL